uniref:Uncharacterized protein n=1 Tax=Xiphophorus maculatus TaxID=8083 RepID=A0A3B5R528_XIPMA
FYYSFHRSLPIIFELITIHQSPPRRQCTIHIVNFSDRYTLENPRYVTSIMCFCADPLPPRILPTSSGSAVFAKTPRTGRGFSGISIYDLCDNATMVASEQMTVVFKVPYDLNFKANEYALGVFDVNQKFNKYVFEHMDKEMTVTKGQAKGPSLIHKSQSVTMRATMSDCIDPVIKVHVSDN